MIMRNRKRSACRDRKRFREGRTMGYITCKEEADTRRGIYQNGTVAGMGVSK